jgi:16S rRNA processing protein RimM
MARPEWIEVGRVARAHGVRGEVRVVPDSDNPDRFSSGSVLHGRPARQGVAGGRSPERAKLTVAAVRGDGDFPIVAFEEIHDRTDAEGLRGYLLEVESGDLPVLGEDEFYPFDLQDLAVRDSVGTVVGRVAEVIDSPAHPILDVSLSAGGKVLVPFVSAAVSSVSLDDGYLVVDAEFLGRKTTGGDEA